MREVERGYRGAVRALRKQQEDRERIDALTAMVTELADEYDAELDLRVTDAPHPDSSEYETWAKFYHKDKDLVRRARALIGEDGKP